MLRPMIAVVVPIRGFRVGKARLASVLSEDERAALSRRMAAGVLEAAAPLPVYVVSSDDEVRAFAQSKRAHLVDDAGSLDAAARAGLEAARADGATRVIIVHADLAKPTPFAWVGEFDGVTIVPDRHGEGTNVLGLPTDTEFEFAYGDGSRARHVAEALRCGLALRVCVDDALGWDVDEPQDLP
ncbi:MAG: 2-phospho-L-lactate guanylyltransferase [Acidimicrobiales bacterium]|nr:2-phospho-L-lactate guanylyltransferase [Acidimicrobiales bacterium]